MTLTQKLTIKSSAARQRLNELSAIEARSEEQNTELETVTAEFQKIEPELRAAIALEGAETATVETTVKPEDRELREILGKASVGSIVSHALRNKSTTGPEKELQDHFELSANEIPLELLRVEHRAVTPAPSEHVNNFGTLASCI